MASVFDVTADVSEVHQQSRSRIFDSFIELTDFQSNDGLNT
jgi:hypothetical protein